MAAEVLGARSITHLGGAGPRDPREDSRRVPLHLLVRVAPQRQLHLAVGEDVRDTETAGLAARELVRLARGEQAHERALQDHEHAYLGLLSPRFALDPLVERDLGHAAQELAHTHRARESARVVHEEAHGVALPGAHVARLFGLGDEQLLGKAPVHEDSEPGHVRHAEKGHLIAEDERPPQRRDRAILRVQVEDHVERVTLARALRDLRAGEQNHRRLLAQIRRVERQERSRRAEPPHSELRDAAEEVHEGRLGATRRRHVVSSHAARLHHFARDVPRRTFARALPRRRGACHAPRRGSPVNRRDQRRGRSLFATRSVSHAGLGGGLVTSFFRHSSSFIRWKFSVIVSW